MSDGEGAAPAAETGGEGAPAQGGAAAMLANEGGGQPPAASEQQAPPADPPASSGETDDWMSDYPPEVQEAIRKKGYKTPADVAKGWAAANKMLGVPEDRLLKIPADGDDEGRDALYNALGRPESADDYEFESFGDESVDAWLKETAHKNGLNQDQTKALAEGLAEQVQESTQAQIQQKLNESAATMGQIHREWGGQADQQMAYMREGARLLGLSTEKNENGLSEMDLLEIDIGTEKMVNALVKLGSSVGESAYVEGRKGGGPLSKEQAAAEIEQLNGDPDFQKKLLSDDPNVKAAAVQKRKVLFDIAYN